MKDHTLKTVSTPAASVSDPLTEMLRQGAKDLIAGAVELELRAMLEKYDNLQLTSGQKAVVRNGYLPTRTIQTGIGAVEIEVPKVRDRSGQGIKFNSALLPPYLKRTKNMDELIPWLYLNSEIPSNFNIEKS